MSFLFIKDTAWVTRPILTSYVKRTTAPGQKGILEGFWIVKPTVALIFSFNF